MLFEEHLAHILVQVIDNFLNQSGQIPQEPLQPFVMERLRHDLEKYQNLTTVMESPRWAAEFNPSIPIGMEASFQVPKINGFLPAGYTSEEFRRFQQMERDNAVKNFHSIPRTPLAINGYQRAIGMRNGMSIGDVAFPHNFNSAQRISGITAETKGKGRMMELDDKRWEEQFAKIDEADQRDLDAQANAAIEAELDDLDRSVNDFSDFESIWQRIAAESGDVRQTLNENPMSSNDDYTLDDLDVEGAFIDFDSHFQEGYQEPQLGNYMFEEDNLFNRTKDPYNEGLKIMSEGGNLSLAALAFEAAVQQNPRHVEAWCILGSVQAQNEKETPAIRALEQALKLDPSNLSALMSLAISYTNEGYDTAAYRTLERWLSNRYPQILPTRDFSAVPDYEIGFNERHTLHKRVTSLFVRAAQLCPQGEHMDPDVQVGLGVLFYGAEEHSKAVDCFEAALASTESGASNRPDQAHLLWNRLGATLANSGRSEEAIAAYEQALTLNPNFVRARYNLGVSCINIGCLDVAAQHLLSALSMHRVVEQEGLARVKEVVGMGAAAGDGALDEGGPAGALSDGEVERLVGMNQSTNLMETLRRVFTSMGRRDLADKVHASMDVEAFRGDFEF